MFTATEKTEAGTILKKNLPVYRAAYSDRTAWRMACLSELVYLRFNDIFKGVPKEMLVEQIGALVGSAKKIGLLKLLNLVNYDPQEEKDQLIGEAKIVGLEVLELFDVKGTQAVLFGCDAFLVLAFRGTEVTSIRDIKSDLNAVSVPCETGGKIHQGFKEAFEVVESQIGEALSLVGTKELPLYITGHSLGGALATIAAKKIKHEGGLAACYTFGSPRVGNEEWVSTLKTPIYRIVNAADPVTLMPPSGMTISIFAWLIQFIPHIGKPMKKMLLEKFNKCMHAGDMRYLTNCKKGDYNKVKLLYSVSLLYRLKALIVNKKSFGKIPSDHSMLIYRKKTQKITMRRS